MSDENTNTEVESADEAGEIQSFDSSILKADKDGNGPILSSTLEPGEKMWADVLQERGTTGNMDVDPDTSDVPAENVPTPSEEEAGEGNGSGDENVQEENGDDSGATGYEAQTVADLKTEIDNRNADRSDDDKINVEAPGNKPELIAALEADDAKHAQ